MAGFPLPSWSGLKAGLLDLAVGKDKMDAIRALPKSQAESTPLPGSNYAKIHGFGPTKYTLFAPWGRVTKTTYHAPKRLWPAPADDATSENMVGQAIPDYDPACFAPVEVPIEPKLMTGIDVMNRATFPTDLLRKCKVAFADTANIDATLLRELEQCDRKLPHAQLGEPSPRIPLLLGVRRACDDLMSIRGEQVSERNVADALAYLREQNLFSSVINPPMDYASQVVDKDKRVARDLAWRIAYKLAITESGMELLYQLTDTPRPTAANDAEKNWQRRQHLNLKHFFKAADNLLLQHDIETDPKPRPLQADPTSLLRYCCRQCEKDVPPPNTLLIHGLPGIQQIMCEEKTESDGELSKSFWQKRIDRTNRLLSNNKVNQQQISTIRLYGDLFDERFTEKLADEVNAKRLKLEALQARQQAAMKDRLATKCVSDGHYSNAPGSFIDHVNDRLRKVEVHLERREMRHERSRLASFFKRGREMVVAENRSFVPASDVLSAQHNPDSMLLHREVMRSTLYVVEELLLRDPELIAISPSGTGASGYLLDADPQRLVLQKIARLAMIRQWQKKPLQYLSNNLAPTQFEIDKLITPESLRQLFGTNQALAGPAREVVIEAFKNVVPRKALTPELLQEWVREILLDPGIPNASRREAISGRDHAAESQDQLKEKFDESIMHLQDGLTSSMVLTNDPVQDFKNVMLDEIANMRLGNVRTFSGGTTHGFTLPNIAEFISAVKTFNMVRLLVTGAYGHRSMANLEVGIPSSGGYIRFTNSHDDEGNGSVGVIVGPKIPAGTHEAGIYATVAAEGGGNVYRAVGISLSLPRGGPAMTGCDGIKPGVNGDAIVAKKLAEVARIMTDTEEAKVEPNDPFPTMSKLRAIFEAAPDISLSQILPGDSRVKEINGGVRAGALVGIRDDSKDFGLNASATANANYAYRTTRFRQSYGAHDVKVAYRGKRKSSGFQMRAPALLGLGQHQGNYTDSSHAGKYTPSVAGSLLGTFGINVELWKSGLATQTTRIIYDGTISKNCYKNIYYSNAKQFIAATEKNLGRWANYVAAHDPDCPAMPLSLDSEENRAEAIRVEAIRQGLVAKHAEGFRKYLAKVSETVHQSKVYFDFLELTPEATKKLNYFYQRRIELRAAGCVEEANACKKVFDALWNDDRTWVPHFIVDSLPQQSNRGASINLGLSLTSEQLSNTTVFTDYYG